MLVILFRVLIVYLIVLLYLRIMGKRQLGEMQPFELVITLIIADIASLPMTQTSMPLLFSLIPLTMLVVLHFIVSFISRKSITLRRVINGKPVVVVSPNGIEFQALKELNMNFDDLMQGVRSCDFYKIEDVQYAIVETNGTITVIPKSECSPVTCKDLKIKLPPASLPLNLIAVGKTIKENVKLAGVDDQFFQDVFQKAKLKDKKEILLLTLDTNGKVFIAKKQGESVELETKYKGEGKW